MREESIHKIEVHVGFICFKDDKVLIVKRNDNRNIYPGLWECGGGQVKSGQTFEDVVRSQAKEELGLELDILKLIDTYGIDVPNNEQKVIPGVCFGCTISKFMNAENPEISKEHSEWKLISIDKLEDYEFIPRIKNQILEVNKILNK